jgi:hypothetical protein
LSCLAQLGKGFEIPHHFLRGVIGKGNPARKRHHGKNNAYKNSQTSVHENSPQVLFIVYKSM